LKSLLDAKSDEEDTLDPSLLLSRIELIEEKLSKAKSALHLANQARSTLEDNFQLQILSLNS
jgi:hypothetical protein